MAAPGTNRIREMAARRHRVVPGTGWFARLIQRWSRSPAIEVADFQAILLVNSCWTLVSHSST